MPARPLERIRVALTEVDAAWMPPGLGHPTALGWATVELDRAALELAGDLGLAADDFKPVAGSVALGARCRVVRGALAGGLALAILEPATEGRLAATLARHGEGPAALWFVADDDVDLDAAATVPGPFGPERVVRAGSVGGLRWFLIGPKAGTIDG